MYGEVFGIIAVVAGASALVVFVLSPMLSKMMHMDESELGGGGHGYRLQQGGQQRGHVWAW